MSLGIYVLVVATYSMIEIILGMYVENELLKSLLFFILTWYLYNKISKWIYDTPKDEIPKENNCPYKIERDE